MIWSEPTLLSVCVMDELLLSAEHRDGAAVHDKSLLILDGQSLKAYIRSALISQMQDRKSFHYLKYLKVTTEPENEMKSYFSYDLDFGPDHKNLFLAEPYIIQTLPFFFLPCLACLLYSEEKEELKTKVLIQAMVSICPLNGMFVYYEFYFFILCEILKSMKIHPRQTKENKSIYDSDFQWSDYIPSFRFRPSSKDFILNSAAAYLQIIGKKRVFFQNKRFISTINGTPFNHSEYILDAYSSLESELTFLAREKELKAENVAVINERFSFSNKFFWESITIFMSCRSYDQCMEMCTSKDRLVAALCGQLAAPFFPSGNNMRHVFTCLQDDATLLRQRGFWLEELHSKLQHVEQSESTEQAAAQSGSTDQVAAQSESTEQATTASSMSSGKRKRDGKDHKAEKMKKKTARESVEEEEKDEQRGQGLQTWKRIIKGLYIKHTKGIKLSPRRGLAFVKKGTVQGVKVGRRKKMHHRAHSSRSPRQSGGQDVDEESASSRAAAEERRAVALTAADGRIAAAAAEERGAAVDAEIVVHNEQILEVENHPEHHNHHTHIPVDAIAEHSIAAHGGQHRLQQDLNANEYIINANINDRSVFTWISQNPLFTSLGVASGLAIGLIARHRVAKKKTQG